ncbi:hypothetical protein L1887_14661 [Cichorium endivia]|nr:hypothetical protein L1887_14661 [Cichorium endivia]
MERLSRLLMEILNGSPNFRGLAGHVKFLKKFSFELFPVAAPVADDVVDIALEVPDLDSIADSVGLDDSVERVVVGCRWVVGVMVVKVVVEKLVSAVTNVGCHHGSALPKPLQRIQDFPKGAEVAPPLALVLRICNSETGGINGAPPVTSLVGSLVISSTTTLPGLMLIKRLRTRFLRAVRLISESNNKVDDCSPRRMPLLIVANSGHPRHAWLVSASRLIHYPRISLFEFQYTASSLTIHDARSSARGAPLAQKTNLDADARGDEDAGVNVFDVGTSEVMTTFVEEMVEKKTGIFEVGMVDVIGIFVVGVEDLSGTLEVGTVEMMGASEVRRGDKICASCSGKRVRFEFAILLLLLMTIPK